MSTKTKKASKKKTVKPATAVHLEGKSNQHVIGIGNLRVVIVHDGDVWFAQGLEIDYAAQGKSFKDVKKQFEDGLCATLHEHLRVYGTIKNVLKIAPPEVWTELLYEKSKKLRMYSQVSEHDLSEHLSQNLPFSQIQYLGEKRAA